MYSCKPTVADNVSVYTPPLNELNTSVGVPPFWRVSVVTEILSAIVNAILAGTALTLNWFAIGVYEIVGAVVSFAST